jgi:hypothetical protein
MDFGRKEKVAVGAGGWYLGFESPRAALGGGVGVSAHLRFLLTLAFG